MAERRKSKRFDTEQEVLLYHGLSKYLGKLNNLSCSGALVSVAALPRLIELGDMCFLAFAAKPEAILCSCKVVHLLETHVGLQFIEAEAQA